MIFMPILQMGDSGTEREVICPRLHSQRRAESGLEPESLIPKPKLEYLYSVLTSVCGNTE